MAPLKHIICNVAARLGRDNFHNEKVMAPLKLEGFFHVVVIFQYFHNEKVMAPLKPRYSEWRGTRAYYFHNEKVMAPLKPVYVFDSKAETVTFP